MQLLSILQVGLLVASHAIAGPIPQSNVPSPISQPSNDPIASDSPVPTLQAGPVQTESSAPDSPSPTLGADPVQTEPIASDSPTPTAQASAVSNPPSESLASSPQASDNPVAVQSDSPTPTAQTGASPTVVPSGSQY